LFDLPLVLPLASTPVVGHGLRYLRVEIRRLATHSEMFHFSLGLFLRACCKNAM
jgi:hypothetical protein